MNTVNLILSECISVKTYLFASSVIYIEQVC